jgi:hypothetical protein
MQSSHGEGGDDASVFHKTDCPGSCLNPTFIFMCRGEVCGRDADDARLIQASVNAPPSVVGFYFQTPQSCDHPDQWATFLTGEQGFAL